MSKSSKQISKLTKGLDFWSYVKSGPINTVSLIPPLIALILILIWAILKQKIFLTAPQIYNYTVLSIAFLLIGLVGILYIYRKEMPGPLSSVTIKGGCAVATGFALLFFFWLLGLATFIFALLE